MDEPGHGIVGRESELARVESFIGSVPEGPSALLLEGAAGIGKTTLWARGSVHGASARTSGAGLPPCHGSSTSSGFVRAQSSPDGSPPPTASRPRSPRPTPNPAGRFASEGFPRFLTAPEDLACSRTSTQPPGSRRCSTWSRSQQPHSSQGRYGGASSSWQPWYPPWWEARSPWPSARWRPSRAPAIYVFRPPG